MDSGHENIDLWSQWTQHKTDNFCESKLWNGQSEYLSALTASFILYFGYLGLHHMPYPISCWKMIFSLFCLNGIGSMLYHFTLEEGWDYVDKITMVIALHLASYHAYNILGYKLYLKKTKHDTEQILYDHPPTELKKVKKSNILSDDQLYNPRFFRCFSSFGCISHMTSCIGVTVLTFFKNGEMIPALATLVLVTILLIQVTIAYKYLYTEEIKCDSNKEFKQAQTFLKRGIILMVISGGIWFGTETLCKLPDYENILKYIPTHAIWHITAACGIYTLGITFSYFDTYNMALQPYFKKKKFYHGMIPMLRLKSLNINAPLPKFQSDIVSSAGTQTLLKVHKFQPLNIRVNVNASTTQKDSSLVDLSNKDDALTFGTKVLDISQLQSQQRTLPSVMAGIDEERETSEMYFQKYNWAQTETVEIGLTPTVNVQEDQITLSIVEDVESFNNDTVMQPTITDGANDTSLTVDDDMMEYALNQTNCI